MRLVVDRKGAFGEKAACALRSSSRSPTRRWCFVSLAVTYLAASFVIFRLMLPDLSLNLHPHFPDIAEIFAQTSKAATAPHDYIALFGDSYAEGQGDGLFAADGDRAKFVHSAHVLHRITGRDVMSLGIGGAGSVQMMVRQPARILLGNCFLYPRLEMPRQIFVYFYEGNDIDENGYIVNLVRTAGRGDAGHDLAFQRATLRGAAAFPLLHGSGRNQLQDGALPPHQHGELRNAAQAFGAQSRCWRAVRRMRRLRCKSRRSRWTQARATHR